MSDQHTDEIRDLLARAMSDAPEPHSWVDVERRARRNRVTTPVRRRTEVWLAAAACVAALIGGLIVVVESDDEPAVRTDDPTGSTSPTAPSTSAPIPTTSRPLAELAVGDVVVPTYIPPGLTFSSAKIIEIRRGEYEFSYLLESADPQYQYSTGLGFTVMLVEGDGALGSLGPQFLDDPDHPPLDIAGVTWGWGDFEPGRVAQIGSFEVWVQSSLSESEVQRFIEGLRAVPLAQFPAPISFNGHTYPNDLADAEIVASDDRFELAALQVGDSACMQLEETNVSAPRTFAPNCWRALNGSGIVDLYPIDDTDTEFLIIGVIDSSVATAVRVTSPEGESVIVPTGPPNQATYGRFFLARLDLDASNGFRLDQFTIEDATP